MAAMLGSCGEDMPAALARLERSMMAVVREIHVDVGSFKRTVERRLDDACDASGPLRDAVAQLQQENQELRARLDELARQAEAVPVLQARLDELTQQVEAMPVLRIEQKVPKSNGVQYTSATHVSSSQQSEESHRSLTTHSEGVRSSVSMMHYPPKSASAASESQPPTADSSQDVASDAFSTGSVLNSTSGSVHHSVARSVHGHDSSTAGSFLDSTVGSHQVSATVSLAHSSTTDSVFESWTTGTPQDSIPGPDPVLASANHPESTTEAFFSKMTPGSDSTHDSDSGSLSTCSYVTQQAFVTSSEARVFPETNVSN